MRNHAAMQSEVWTPERATAREIAELLKKQGYPIKVVDRRGYRNVGVVTNAPVRVVDAIIADIRN